MKNQPNSLPFTSLQNESTGKAIELQHFLQQTMTSFPWQIEVNDWDGNSYSIGQGKQHWRGTTMKLTIKTERAGRLLLGLQGLKFLDAYVEGEVDIEDNLYLAAEIRNYAKLNMSKWEIFSQIFSHLSFQNISRAKVNVKSHYDIPQDALNIYLDKVYMSYSCGMWENPQDMNIQAMRQVGKGEADTFDSLEKSHWRKFKDAVDFINPDPGDTLLDVGCGYGGQLVVALENHPFSQVVGWTHSNNQVTEGKKMLAKFANEQYELNEGDYREEHRIFDHITSTGMVSHVGPRGLVPYIKNIRKRIKSGGRYVHHALMIPAPHQPMDKEVGIAFNKKYVWPGYHWFTIGQHITALENNGFEVTSMRNLSPHYAKTAAAWAERMVDSNEKMIAAIGDASYRAWKMYLYGAAGGFLNKKIHVYRVYCEAV